MQKYPYALCGYVQPRWWGSWSIKKLWLEGVWILCYMRVVLSKSVPPHTLFT